jgi:cell division protein FtsI/penicillin-binding protein 2
MFEAKLNYLTAGAALVVLLLLGRFAWLQLIQHDQHIANAEQMRTGASLLEPQRADIILRDGTVVAETVSVWDIYLDLEAFADPRTIALRAHASPTRYDTQAVDEFTGARLEPVLKGSLPGPASRRRLLLSWLLRHDPVSRQDFEICAQRLCLVTGLPRAVFDQKVAQIQTEVEGLLAQLGNPAEAPARDVSVAWLRVKPALSDPEYWARIQRFPKSIHFAPVLRARLGWFEQEAQSLEALIEAAEESEDPAHLRDLCFQAMQTCRRRADALPLEVEAAEGNTLAQAQDLLLEEHAHWQRLAAACEGVVRGEADAVAARHRELTRRGGVIDTTRERLEKLEKHTIARFAEDWKARWQHYTFEENPLLLLKDAPRDVIELLKVNGDLLPGIRCERRPSRRYHNARELAHVLGNVGMPDPARLDAVLSRPSFGEGLDEFIERWFQGEHSRFVDRFEGVVAHQLVGTDGIERAYDERLSGLYGARVTIRDAGGRQRAIDYEQAPVHSDPLTLTIDLELQQDILDTAIRYEPLLGSEAASKRKDSRWSTHKWSLRGAAVVIDLETGAVLAMASFPSYDPDRLRGHSPQDRAYQRQFAMEAKVDENLPWWNRKSRAFNRATQGLYAPGSTFKVLTATALLDSGTITPGSTFDEIGEWERGTYKISHEGKFLGRTAHPFGPGVDLYKALEASSNGYFYRWSQALGPTPAQAWTELRGYAEQFGFGRPMNSDFSASKARMPEEHEVWAPNLAALSIGQGALVSTPMEVARLYATVATRGRLVTPHLSDEAMVFEEWLDVSQETWDAVHEGMRLVSEGRHGTAREHAVLKRIRCAGKTGTAENGLGIPDHAWFAGFAPHDNPKVAFVFLAANSDLYGADVAPLIAEPIERYLKRIGAIE